MVGRGLTGLTLVGGRKLLERELKLIFGRPRQPGPLHRFIATLAPLPRLIVTTNYDTLVEDGLRSANVAFHLIMTPVDRLGASTFLWWRPGDSAARVSDHKSVLIEPVDVPIVYKIHGGLAPNGDWIRAIITDVDYFEVGGRLYASSYLPMEVAAVLRRSSLLFLGYSLRDTHVRFMVQQSAEPDGQRHFLVTKKISRIDRVRLNALGIIGVELTIADFIEQFLNAKVQPGTS